jgi:hypothetical protein
MYGSHLDFSGVTLPGVGGGLNSSNAVGMNKLQEMNATGKKWRPDISGSMSNHNENILKMNEMARAKKESLVNRDYHEQCDGSAAMKEIFARKKARMSSFKEMKKNEYGFAEGDSQDAEVLSIPHMSECKCGGACASCRDKKRKDAEFREWSTEKRKDLKSGKVTGEFAGPEMSFPISSAEDVAAAWASVGRAKDPRAIMRNILAIAKKHGWESGLPQSVKDRQAAGQSGLPS